MECNGDFFPSHKATAILLNNWRLPHLLAHIEHVLLLEAHAYPSLNLNDLLQEVLKSSPDLERPHVLLDLLSRYGLL